MLFKNTAFDANILREILSYDEATGEFRWREDFSRKVKAGDRAGAVSEQGYVRIGIWGTQYRAHRLAWLYVHGEWPPQQIDHINNDRRDNRISNLRLATSEINAQNRRTALPGNSSGLLGVSASGKRYVASISHMGKNNYLGRFDDPAEAHAAYVKAKRQLHKGCSI